MTPEQVRAVQELEDRELMCIVGEYLYEIDTIPSTDIQIHHQSPDVWFAAFGYVDKRTGKPYLCTMYIDPKTECMDLLYEPPHGIDQYGRLILSKDIRVPFYLRPGVYN